MVDFRALRDQRAQAKSIAPRDIFLRLPKAPGINDLWQSQAEALDGWFSRRNERDLLVKLNTGGGKTLVGLLIAQSSLNELGTPVLYLTPNNLLVDQTMKLAKDYGIQTVRYSPGSELDSRFLAGQAVMVGTYAALFNGLSKFGVSGGNRDIVNAGAIVLDDAHAALSDVRDTFSLTVQRDAEPELFQELAHLFRTDFGGVGRQGTFDDIVSGKEWGVLEVPYWSWLNRADEIRQRLATRSELFTFSWPLIRDHFSSCHALISDQAFTITPITPMIDMFPTFSACNRRVYMSATVTDDGAMIRTLGIAKSAIANPISPASLAGVGERMVLIPELTGLPHGQIRSVIEKLVPMVTQKHGGCIILTPSTAGANRWSNVAEVAVGAHDVGESVDKLRSKHSRGPYVIPNRYDGIDLPDESCRLLILDGLPRTAHAYELYRATIFEGSSAINATIAQRVEQGMGRGSRGGGDHCVVVLTGKDLVAWLSRSGSSAFLSPATSTQLAIGLNVSKDIANEQEFNNVASKCLTRDQDWVEYHAEVLADSAAASLPDALSLDIAECERKVHSLLRDNLHEKAIAWAEKFCDDHPAAPTQVQGWLKQLAAWVAHAWGRSDLAVELQRKAYAQNHALLRPPVELPYQPIPLPSQQAVRLVEVLGTFQHRKGLLAQYEQVVDLLTPNATSNQFEQSLKEFGSFIGFETQRPEKEFGKGPDVLWLTPLGALVIEAKSQKLPDNPLTKHEHGQLLEAYQWFRKEYPGIEGTKVVVHPNQSTTERVTAEESRALTLESLARLVGDTRQLLSELCYSSVSDTALPHVCEQLLSRYKLTPVDLQEYLSSWQLAEAAR